MYKISALLSCLVLTSCVTKPVFISDINAKRVMGSSSTHLERMVSEDEAKDLALGVAVLVGIDESEKSYVALAPSMSTATTLDIKNINHSLIRTLDKAQAKELLRVVEFAIANYDKEVSKLESINANFQSALESESLVFQGTTLTPIRSEFFMFTFVNIGRGSEATMDFGGVSTTTTSGVRKMKKDKLMLLKQLLTKAIVKIDAQHA